MIFVCGRYLIREANSFLDCSQPLYQRSKKKEKIQGCERLTVFREGSSLKENCELWEAGNVQRQTSEHIFKVK